MRDRRRTWMLGGTGLIACGVLGMLRTTVPGGLTSWTVLAVMMGIIYAGAVLLFAIGTSTEGSVVARRPLGVISMAIVALWPLVDTVADLVLPRDAPTFGAWTTYDYVALIVQTGAALIAASQIGRAGIVASPWRWAPLWVLGLQAFAWAVPQIAFVSMGSDAIQSSADLYVLLGTVTYLAGTLGLGILALVLAAQQRPDSVEVYRSA